MTHDDGETAERVPEQLFILDRERVIALLLGMAMGAAVGADTALE